MTQSGPEPVVRPTPRSVAAPGDWSTEHPAQDAPRKRSRAALAVAGRYPAGGAGALTLLVVLLAVLRRRRRRGGWLARFSR